MKLRNILVGCLVVLAVGCTRAPKANTPEGALQHYVTAAFDAKSPSARKTLMEYSAGDALFYLERMSDEDFKRQFIDSNLRLVNMKTKDLRQEVNGDVSLVYELSYKEGETSNPTVHTNKKIAYLTKDDKGNWKIKATKNVKTFVERKEDLMITPETTEQQPAAAKK